MQNSIAWPSMIQSSGLLVFNSATLIFPRKVRSRLSSKKCSLARVHVRILPLRQVERTKQVIILLYSVYAFLLFLMRRVQATFLVRWGFFAITATWKFVPLILCRETRGKVYRLNAKNTGFYETRYTSFHVTWKAFLRYESLRKCLLRSTYTSVQKFPDIIYISFKIGKIKYVVKPLKNNIYRTKKT